MVGQPQPGDERDTQPVVSIIVACKAIDQYVLQCIDETKKLDFQSYEVIVLPDSENEEESLSYLPARSLRLRREILEPGSRREKS